MYHQSPVSSRLTWGARSANSLSILSVHRSGGSMMWLSEEIIDSNDHRHTFTRKRSLLGELD